jgi:hypothetical protein
LVFGLATTANAADMTKAPIYWAPPPFAENYIIESNNQIIAQFVSTYLNYGETADARNGGTPPAGSLMDTEKGWVPGFGVKYSFMGDLLVYNLYFELEFSSNYGSTNYIGGLIFPPTPYGSVTMTDGATFTDFSNRLGEGIALEPNVMVTPYVEWGYHRWKRDVNLGETYQHFYLGVGGLLQFSPFARFVLSGNGMVGYTISPWIDVAGPSGFSASLGSKPTYKIGLSGDYAIAPHWHASLGAEYTYFKYGETDIVPGPGGWYSWEPNSSSKVTTIKVGLGYAF